MPRRTKLTTSHRVKDSVKYRDSDDMDVGDSSSAGNADDFRPRGPLFTSMEEPYPRRQSSMVSCSTCTTLETVVSYP